MEKRPLGVTIVGLLILFAGVLAVVESSIVLITNIADGFTAYLGGMIVALLVGVIYLLLARGIFTGSRLARIIVAIVTVLSILGDVLLLITGEAGVLLTVVGLAISVVILVILFGNSGKRFFEAST